MKTAKIRLSRTFLVLLHTSLFFYTCVFIPSCKDQNKDQNKDDGFQNGCLQFVDKEMERFIIEQLHWDVDHNNCLTRNEIDSIKHHTLDIDDLDDNGRVDFYPFQGKLCDNYAIKTLDDLAHIPQIDAIYGFHDCKSLETAHLPNIRTIGNFKGCSNLREIDFTNLERLPEEAFADCTALTRVEFPQVEAVGASAFYGAMKIQEIILPNAWELPNRLDIKEFYDKNGYYPGNYYIISDSPVLKKLVLSSPRIKRDCPLDESSNRKNYHACVLINPLKDELSKQVKLVLNESTKPYVEFRDGAPYRWANAEWKSIQFVGLFTPLLDIFNF